MTDNTASEVTLAPQINADRLAEVLAASLEKGAHEESERRMCVMEATP